MLTILLYKGEYGFWIFKIKWFSLCTLIPNIPIGFLFFFNSQALIVRMINLPVRHQSSSNDFEYLPNIHAHNVNFISLFQWKDHAASSCYSLIRTTTIIETLSGFYFSLDKQPWMRRIFRMTQTIPIELVDTNKQRYIK